MNDTKHLRLFAGPEGSGKSTIRRFFMERFNLGIVVDPEVLQSALASGTGLSLAYFSADLTAADLRAFFAATAFEFPFAERPESRWGFSEAGEKNRAHAVAALADYLCQRLIERGVTFTVETTLAEPSWPVFLKSARDAGYAVYLYYVCVASPKIAQQRTVRRAIQGGLGVSDEAYEASLARLADTIALSERAYLFDNTLYGASLKLEIRRASETIPYEPQLPEWIVRHLPPLEPLA